jgi:threonine dehydrogenase-like Zn-dependent dehydrogenase
MKTVKAFGPKDLRLVEVPKPVPGEGEVLIAVKVCGVCGSDKWFWEVSEPTDYVAGHEVAGQVAAVGPGVHWLQVGDRVAVNNVRGCGHCPACRAGQYVRCPQLSHMGHGFSEFVTVPERNCLRLHPTISYEAGSLIFDLWGTPYAALGRAGVSHTDDVVIFGCGPIGLAAVALAKHYGAYVIAIDPLAYRREAAQRNGANVVLSPDDIDTVRDLTSGIGASVILECSGKGAAYTQAFSAVRIGGTLVSVGEGAAFECKPSDMLIHRHLNWLGSLYTSMEQGQQVQNLMVQQHIDPMSFVTHRFTLEELPQAFGKVVECTDEILKAIILMGEN